MRVFEHATAGFTKVLVRGDERAKRRGSPAFDAPDLLCALLDQPWRDGNAFLARIGVDLEGSRQRAARAFPDPEPDPDGDLVPGAGPRTYLPFTVDLKEVIRTAAGLQQDVGSPHCGTEHLAAALVSCRTIALAMLAVRPLTRRQALRQLRSFAAAVPSEEARYQEQHELVRRASRRNIEGAYREALALLAQLGPVPTSGPHLELAAEAAILRASWADEVDQATFAAALAEAEPLVVRAGGSGLTTHLRTVVASAAVHMGDVAPLRALVSDLDAGSVPVSTGVIASLRVTLLRFDGDLEGARRTISEELAATEEGMRSATGARRVLRPMYAVLVASLLAQAAGLEDDADEASEAARRSLAMLDRERPPAALVHLCGQVLAHHGQPDARAPLEWVVSLAYDNGLASRWTCAQYGLCVLAARTEPNAAVDQAMADLTARLDELGLRPTVIGARLDQARLAVALGRVDDARRHLDDADARAHAIGSRGWVDRVVGARAELMGPGIE